MSSLVHDARGNPKPRGVGRVTHKPNGIDPDRATQSFAAHWCVRPGAPQFGSQLPAPGRRRSPLQEIKEALLELEWFAEEVPEDGLLFRRELGTNLAGNAFLKSIVLLLANLLIDFSDAS